MIEVIAIVGFLIAALAAAQWLRARARLREALLGRDAVEQSRAALAAVLDTVPVAALWWRRDGSEENAVGAVPGKLSITELSSLDVACVVSADLT